MDSSQIGKSHHKHVQTLPSQRAVEAVKGEQNIKIKMNIFMVYFKCFTWKRSVYWRNSPR